jgi:hypothetical protein
MAKPVVNGKEWDERQLHPDSDYSVISGDCLFVIRTGKSPNEWMDGLDLESWYYAENKGVGKGPFTLRSLLPVLTSIPDISNVVMTCRGLHGGFFAEQILKTLSKYFPTSPASHERQHEALAGGVSINTEYGEYTCPTCWLRFDRGDVMHISVHGNLSSDPVLGEGKMQRFFATRFNDRGQALDPMGVPTSDIACPHCRRKLAPGFLDTPHYIFSIVGAPSSGKSYYLSVLAKTLPSALFKHYGVSFRDADPSANVSLNEMKSQLFSAGTAAEAQLAKTRLDQTMYEELPRLGHKVFLPKPFIFQLSKSDVPDGDFSVVFYDNAGEHFQPGMNSAESPGAQHVAAASAIFFLFDPLHNSDFRERLTGTHDPQLKERRADLDQQDVILSETEVRLKTLLGMDSRKRVSTPLAVLVGKCDAWLHLLKDVPLEDPISDGRFDMTRAQQNSQHLRDLLLDICPAIVSNAESISDNVMYFAVSPLGGPPEVIGHDEKGRALLSPDPKKIAPRFVEVPTLWALSIVSPDFVPTH